VTELVRLDDLLRAWIVGHRSAPMDGIMWALSIVGRGGTVWLAIGLGLAAARRLPFRQLIHLALAVLAASLMANYVMKPAIGRDRPFVRNPNVRVIGGRPDDASFPSGHAASSAAAAFELSRFVPSLRILWWTLAIAIAYSRVYLGVHYPLDVAGGALVGLAFALAANRVWRLPSLSDQNQNRSFSAS
jgi:undecaprenyl-diphosphatase